MSYCFYAAWCPTTQILSSQCFAILLVYSLANFNLCFRFCFSVMDILSNTYHLLFFSRRATSGFSCCSAVLGDHRFDLAAVLLHGRTVQYFKRSQRLCLNFFFFGLRPRTALLGTWALDIVLTLWDYLILAVVIYNWFCVRCFVSEYLQHSRALNREIN